MPGDFLPLAFLDAYLYAFEYFEACRNCDISASGSRSFCRFAAARYFSGIDKIIDPVDFGIARVHVEDFGDVRLVFGLHRRHIEVAVVGEADAAQSFPDGTACGCFHACAFPVEGKLAVIVIVEKH